MIGRSRPAWLLAGSAACLLALASASPADAQSRIDTTIQSLPKRQTTQQRQQRPTPPTLEDEEAAPARRSEAGAGIDPDLDAEDGAERQPSRIVRRTPVDGDLGDPDEAMPRDGVIEDGDPQLQRLDPDMADPLDPAQTDARFADDIAAFARPPAGYDALAFQAEVDPILDRRPARLARFEPYDPIGFRAGSWVVFPEAEIAGFATNNVFSGPDRRGDAALSVKPTVRAVTDWRAHAIELKGTGLATFFNEHPSEDDRAYGLEARGRFDVSRSTTIEALASNELTQESRSSINAPANARGRSDVETSRLALAFNQRFNRLTVQLRGSVAEIDYTPVILADGSTESNRERSYDTREGVVRTSWRFKPTLAAFAETAINDRDFRAAASDGIARDSSGERYRVGISFGNISQILRGEISVGWGRQRTDDRRLVDIDGFIVDANIGYRMSALTSFLVSARSDFVEYFGAGSAGGIERRIGLEARHAFRRELIGIAGIGYRVTDYAGIDVTERELVNELGLEYFVNRNVTTFARYSHTVFDANAAGADYHSDAFRVGMRIRQ